MPEKSQYGTCRLCGRNGKLSYEHVPPKSAFNDSIAVVRKIDQYLAEERGERTRGDLQRRGAGGYTLCEKCNNCTGSWYGDEYVSWARSIAPRVFDYKGELRQVTLSMFCVRPLRFLKQCITCLFSVNPEEFGTRHPYLRQFVLNRDLRGLPPQYDVYLTLV